MKDKSKRQKWLHLRVTDEEHNRLQNAYKATTCRKLSDYLRNVLFKQPITVFYRNRSADEFLVTALDLKRELNSIGKNINQVVKRIGAFRTAEELSLLLLDLLTEQKIADQQAKNVCQKMDQIYCLLTDEAAGKGVNMVPADQTVEQAAAADEQRNRTGQ